MSSISVKLAVYAHFNVSGEVQPFAWPYLDSLLELGFELVFVSNSAIINEDKLRLEAMSARVIIRENTGLDFGMWKSALEGMELSGISELLLTNSSVIGPVLPLGPIFEKARAWNCDFWGMTDSTEVAPHLQSYFIMLSEKVIRSDAFKEFWKSVLPYQSKEQIIRSYEIGFTIWLQEQGFTWRPLVCEEAVWDAHIMNRDLLRRIGSRFRVKESSMRNVTLLFPDRLLEMGMPFVKSSLLAYDGLVVRNPKSFKVIQKYKS